MSKAVLISIRPEWCEKIVGGRKTLELRKTAPTIKPPFKCYIYCTKFKYGEILCFPQYKTGKVIGEFVCDRLFPYCQAKPIENAADVERQSCLTRKEVWEYAPEGNPVGWHISDLVVYDEPKELAEFYKNGTLSNEAFCETTYDGKRSYADYLFTRVVRKPPQSWFYVEEEIT